MMIDSKEQIKEAAYFCLKAALGILNGREKCNEILMRIYEQAKLWIGTNDTNKIYGGIMVVDSLIESNTELLKPKYLDICQSIFKYDGKALIIKNAVMSIIPKLANCMVSLFITKYLDKSMNHMISHIKTRSPAKSISMTSRGEISLKVDKSAFQVYFDKVYELFEKEIIRQKKPFCIEAVDCIRMLCKNFNSEILSKPNIMELIESTYSAGFCTEVIEAMKDIANTNKI